MERAWPLWKQQPSPNPAFLIGGTHGFKDCTKTRTTSKARAGRTPTAKTIPTAYAHLAKIVTDDPEAICRVLGLQFPDVQVVQERIGSND